VEPPVRSKIRLYQYADFEEQWWWIADGLGVDFTGCTASLALRATPQDTAPLLQVSTTANAAGQITLGTNGGGNAGLVQLVIFRAAINPLSVRVAHGDLLITMANGLVQEFAEILALINPGNTY
jgi:hypothetical protein